MNSVNNKNDSSIGSGFVEIKYLNSKFLGLFRNSNNGTYNEGVYGVGESEFAEARRKYFDKLRFTEQQNKTEQYHITTRKTYNFKSGAFESDYSDQTSVKNAMTEVMLKALPQKVVKNTLTPDIMNDKVAVSVQEPEIINNNQQEINNKTEGFSLSVDSEPIPVIIHPSDEFKALATNGKLIQLSDSQSISSDEIVWFLEKKTVHIEPDVGTPETYYVYQISFYSPREQKWYCLNAETDTKEGYESNTSNESNESNESTNESSDEKGEVIHYNSLDLSEYDNNAQPVGVSVIQKQPITAQHFEKRDGAKPILNSLWMLSEADDNTFKIIPFRWQTKYQLVPKPDLGFDLIESTRYGWNFEPYEEKGDNRNDSHEDVELLKDCKFSLASVPYKSLTYKKLPSSVQINSITIGRNTQVLIKYDNKWFSICNYENTDYTIQPNTKQWSIIFGEPNKQVKHLNGLVVLKNKLKAVRDNAKQTFYDISNDIIIEHYTPLNAISNNQAARNVLLVLVLLVVIGFCCLLWLSIKNNGDNELDKRFYASVQNSSFW